MFCFFVLRWRQIRKFQKHCLWSDIPTTCFTHAAIIIRLLTAQFEHFFMRAKNPSTTHFYSPSSCFIFSSCQCFRLLQKLWLSWVWVPIHLSSSRTSSFLYSSLSCNIMALLARLKAFWDRSYFVHNMYLIPSTTTLSWSAIAKLMKSKVRRQPKLC